MVIDDMVALLAPQQLGYGVKSGAETAAHAARIFLVNMDSKCALVKMDFKHVFATGRE